MIAKAEELTIPIIDLEPMRSGDSDEAHETGKKLYEAFRSVGFAYIKNHGIPQDVVDEAFVWVRLYTTRTATGKLKASPLTRHHRALDSLPCPKQIRTEHHILRKDGIIVGTRALAVRRSYKWSTTKIPSPS